MLTNERRALTDQIASLESEHKKAVLLAGDFAQKWRRP